MLVLICAGWLNPGTQAQTGATAEYQVYQLRHKSAAEVQKVLEEMLANTGTTTHLVLDSKANQLLLRGPEKAQAIARQLIQSMDRPGEAVPAGQPVVKAYPCAEGRQAETAARLRSLFGNRNDVRVAADPQSGQIFVLAPPKLHEEIPRHIPAPAEPRGEPSRRRPLSETEPTEQFVPLAHARPEEVETTLRELLAGRLFPLSKRWSGRSEYRFVDPAGRRLELGFDRQQNGVIVSGPGPLAGQFVRLLRSLDTRPDAQGRATRIVPVRNADPAKVREAVEAYRNASREESAPQRIPQRAGNPGDDSRRPPRVAPQKNDQGNLFPHAGVELVSYLFQQAEVPSGASGGAGEVRPPAKAAPPGTAPKPGAPVPEERQPLDAEERRERLRQMGIDVEIETLPDLDVIILRGRDRDVDEVRRIIEEIERLSAEAEPTIEIYFLRHVGGEALMTIVKQVSAEVLEDRQGRVSITPLVKPNALLLIGWGEALKKAKELIRKLDAPVKPETQQRVYRLRHASATTVRTTIQGFFSGRTGLGPRVEVTADPRTNALIVQASPRDLQEVELLLEKLDTDTPEAVMQTRIFRLKNSLAADLYSTLQSAIDAARGGGAAGQKSAALELLAVDPKGEKLVKSGILDDVRVTPDTRLNTLIVAAPAESMELLATLIQQLDAPASVAQIKVFRVVNGDANEQVRTLRTLVPAQLGAGLPQLAAAEGEASTTPLRFSVDARTNSIIAVGSPGDLRIIEALLLRLDAQDVQQRQTTVYRLKNAPAPAVAASINEYLRTERQVQQAAPGVLSPFQQIESEVVVVPEEVSNSLIISATPRFFKEIEALVKQLDEQPLQVVIQVLIAEVSLRNTDEFGVELGLQDSILFDRSLLDDIFTVTNTIQQSNQSGIVTQTDQNIVGASNTPGFNFNNQPLGNSGADKALGHSRRVGPQGLSSFATGRMNSELGFGGLVLSASSESVSVLVRALHESQRLEILGRPHIMTLDNQSAFIHIGKRVPRITGTQFAGSFGQNNQISLETVGLILGVTPRISPDGKVVMEIDAEKSELGPESEGIAVSIAEGTVIRSPTINLTMAQTTVSAGDGETIVLGGLITKNTSNVERKVPYLADIPLLGNLFKYKSSQVKRSELLIVLTPHVVRSPEEIERIKRIETSRMHWCLEDVHQIHGDGGLLHQGSGPEVVYPDSNPRGKPADKPQPKTAPPGSDGTVTPRGQRQSSQPAGDPYLLRPIPSQRSPQSSPPTESSPEPPPGPRDETGLFVPGAGANPAAAPNPLRGENVPAPAFGQMENGLPPGPALPAVYNQR